MFKRLLSHLEKNNLLAEEQFRFRSRLSTDQAAYTMVNGILTALNDKVKVGGIFCDLQKASDYLDHKILIEKMKFYRIEEKFNSLI